MTGATFCWWCGKPLAEVFAVVMSPSGDELRVHVVCKDNAAKSFKPHPVTAQEVPKETYRE